MIAGRNDEPKRAIPLFKASAELGERLGDRWLRVASLVNLVDPTIQDGDWVRARALWQEVLFVLQDLGGENAAAATTTMNLANLDLLEGRLDSAQRQAAEPASRRTSVRG